MNCSANTRHLSVSPRLVTVEVWGFDPHVLTILFYGLAGKSPKQSTYNFIHINSHGVTIKGIAKTGALVLWVPHQLPRRHHKRYCENRGTGPVGSSPCISLGFMGTHVPVVDCPYGQEQN